MGALSSLGRSLRVVEDIIPMDGCEMLSAYGTSGILSGNTASSSLKYMAEGVLHPMIVEETVASKTGARGESGCVFVARQPIFDRDRSVHSYRLLFHPRPCDPSLDADPAVSLHLIASMFLSIGGDALLGDQPAFIAFDRAMLMAGFGSM